MLGNNGVGQRTTGMELVSEPCLVSTVPGTELPSFFFMAETYVIIHFQNERKTLWKMGLRG